MDSQPARASSSAGSPLFFSRERTFASNHRMNLMALRRMFKGTSEDPAASEPTGPNHLQPRDWVDVRGLDEIAATLEEGERLQGLHFMPEMKAFCGGRYRVFKRVETIKLETTGAVQRLRIPVVSLEGVYCDGADHMGCDRACFHLWREEWLKRVTRDEQPE